MWESDLKEQVRPTGWKFKESNGMDSSHGQWQESEGLD